MCKFFINMTFFTKRDSCGCHVEGVVILVCSFSRLDVQWALIVRRSAGRWHELMDGLTRIITHPYNVVTAVFCAMTAVSPPSIVSL